MKEKPINTIIDESWDLALDEESKTFIEGLAMRARKYQGPVITGFTSFSPEFLNYDQINQLKEQGLTLEEELEVISTKK